MNTINNQVQTNSPPWKKPGTLLILGLGLLLVGMSTQAATDCKAVTDISTIECESLLELYHSTNGAEWTRNAGWKVTNTPCSWYGVTCEKGGVTEINLGDYLNANKLKGTLPNFKGLPNLQRLFLDNNQLIGTIPDFSALPNLQILFLSNNQLTGVIPNFSFLPQLQTLSFYNNQLIGAIPDFSALPNLSSLSLSNNQLTGAIPNFSTLSNLKRLYLSNNQLTDTIPDFSALPNLEELGLLNNQLTGTIPDFSALPNLEELGLLNNQLTGTIPDFTALPNLQLLLLSNNQLIGGIPDFSALPNLEVLWLSNNQLIGGIPDFSALPNLLFFYIDDNQLTGAIPDFSALTELGYLDLRNNPICKDSNINYSYWPIQPGILNYDNTNNELIFSDEPTWQEQLNTFQNCSSLTPTIINLWPPHGMAPLRIDLDASDSEGSISQYAWTINGQTLSGQSNSITLTEAGEHTLVLSVTGNEGQTATIEKSVFVWQPGQAIIIAGPDTKDSLFNYTNEFTQRMYRLLKKRGYDDDQIHYLNVLAPDIDPPDGRPEAERQDYQLFDPKKELSEAFAQAAAHLKVGDQFVFYLHGHASDNRFKLVDENISATHLRDLLATLPAGVQQIIILDTCYAGSFLDELAGVPHRVVVTSTDDNSLTFQVVHNSFANEFMQMLDYGGSVFEAFRDAEQMILNEPKYFTGQRPWLDDDNDGQFFNDGLYAENVHIGLRRIEQAPPPEIKQVHPRITLPENEGTTTLWVKMTDNENIHRVRAILIPPEYELKAYQGEKTDFSRIEVPMQYNAVEENYGVKYEGFCAQAGLWQILYQAQDAEGAWSKIVPGEVQAPECVSASVKMQLNQSRYTTGNLLRLDMQVNGQKQVDLYVAIIFPDKNFITIAYPLNFSWPNAIQTYQPAVEIAGQKTYPIMDFPLPAGIPTGGYEACGVLVSAGKMAKEPNNWIDSHCAGFEVY